MLEHEDKGHGIKVKCEEEEISAKPATQRKQWYIDLTDESDENGERLEKKQKTQAGPSEVIDLT